MTADASVRRLGRDTAIYGAAILVSRAAGFIMLPVYTRYLTPADYGIMQLLDMTLEVVTILAAAGLTAGLLRFYYKADTPERRLSVFPTALALVMIGKAVAAIALLATAPRLAAILLDSAGHAPLIRVAAITFLLQDLTLIPLALAQTQQRAVLFSIVSICRLVIQLTLNITFVVGMEMGVLGVLLSSLITTSVFGLLMGTWMLRQTGLRFSGETARDLIRFGFPYKLSHAGLFISTFGDRFFLKAAEGLASVGLYGLAYQFGFLLSHLGSEPYLRAWNPQRFAMAEQSRTVRDAFYNRGFIGYSLILVTLAVAISLGVRPLLMVMASPEFRGAALFVPVILGAQLLLCWAVIVEFGIAVSERTKYNTYATWISVAVILLLYAVLIPRFGGMGAAVAALISAALKLVLTYYWAQRLWPISYDWKPHIRLLSFAVVIAGSAIVSSAGAGFWRQAITGAALFSVYLALAWYGGVLPPDDRRMAVEAVRQRVRAWQINRA